MINYSKVDVEILNFGKKLNKKPVAWSISEGRVDQKQIINFVWLLNEIFGPGTYVSGPAEPIMLSISGPPGSFMLSYVSGLVETYINGPGQQIGFVGIHAGPVAYG